MGKPAKTFLPHKFWISFSSNYFVSHHSSLIEWNETGLEWLPSHIGNKKMGNETD